MRDVVAIEVEGDINVHARGHNNVYATLCGLDGEDYNQHIVPLPRVRARIDCPACKQIWSHARNYLASDFKRSAK